MKKVILNSLLILVAILFASCSSDDDNSSSNLNTNTIADFVNENPNYSSLKSALDLTSLTPALSSSTELTVFAPDNDSFDVFLSSNGFSSLDDVPLEVLEQVLLNHVIQGVNASSSLSTGYVKTLAEESSTMNKIDMYINTSNGVMLNGEASVVVADIFVDNGVIHAVDNVISLPSVVTFASADNTFTSLVSALTRESSFTYVSTLSSTTSPAPFTVFAPTNDAFGNLLSELGASSLNDIATATLEATLNTHVVANANVLSTDLTDGMTVNTLGDSFVINTTSGVTFLDQNDRVGNVIVANVQAANGVIHVVDRVILPYIDSMQSNTIADFVTNNSDYSSLKAALDRAGLTSVLSGSDEFTVFAPNNASFNTFLTANGFSSLEEVPVAFLEQVLLNHVVAGTNLSTSLSTGYVKTLAEESSTMNKIDMYINTSNGVMLNGEASVTSADIDVDNGVIHAVSSVINLPTVVTFATADNTFSTLVAALTRENEFSYVSTLSSTTSPAPFTVFAPTNDAFGSLLSELGASSLNDIATATLEATLNTHVVANANVLSTDLTDGMTVSTLGDTFVINTTSGVTFLDQNDRTGNIIVADVQASNGVIHVVDRVILPNLN